MLVSQAPDPCCPRCTSRLRLARPERAVARLPLFQKDGDYDAFEGVLSAALQEHPTCLLAYCLMPNHYGL
jgi:hypothetical protein